MRFMPCAGALALVVLVLPGRALGQTPPDHDIRSPLTSVFTADIVRDLPLGETAFAILENTQAEVIADRFTSGGLSVGGDARVGGFLGSWSQTLFRVGDLDVSDPSGGGAPLLSPDLTFWRQITMTHGLMPADINAPGLAITLDPQRGGTVWRRTFRGSGSGGSLAAGAPTDLPAPIARLHDFAFGSALVSGPLSPRLSLAAGGRMARGTSFDREALPATPDTTGAGFLHVVFVPSPAREWRLLGWADRSEAPHPYWQTFPTTSASTATTGVHLQSTFEQHAADGPQWRVFAGLTQRTRNQDLPQGLVQLDRLTTGPVSNAVETFADTTTRRVSLGGRLAPSVDPSARHHVSFGADLSRATTDTSNLFTGQLRELVAGPARIWTFRAGTGGSQRGVTTADLFAADQLQLSDATTLDLAVRGELIHGGAADAATAVTWVSLLPHAYLRWQLSSRRALIFGYSRQANTLDQRWLAFGDPGAGTATVAAASLPGTVVSRVGPGTGGAASFSGIDPDLRRPTTDEFVVGFEKRRSAQTRYTLTGIIRRESNLLAVVDIGAPASAYAIVSFPDAGKDLVDPSDDRALLVYNRLPASFGQDRYLVTNPGQDAATAYALRMNFEHQSDRLFTLFGATASAAMGSGGNPGYGPLENDQDVPGDLFVNPNAASYARGRLFSDRAFTIKWTTLYRFPGDVTVGGIARYQDGQPFSRLVVVPGLNQGTEAVQSYPNGGSRYTFTGTFDLRAQKGFRVGPAHVAAICDVYNLFTRGNEVEEIVISGPEFRTPSAIEPPHAIHLGLRLTF